MIAGRYRLGEAIGSGGMGRVWLAHDERLDRDVAIKEIILQPGGEQDAAAARRRTLREARAAARLNHPGVVAVYDVFEADGKPWIVMEHVPSRSLKEVVQQDGPLEDRQAAVIGLQILEALEAAHRAGVQHRDVKPANVLITEDGRVVLTDFGIATIEGDALVTNSGQLHVSLDYMAPERAQEGQATEASDLWSLGATLYDAVEGHAPFHRASAVGTLTAIAVDPPDPMERPTGLAPVITGLLQKDQSKRLSAAEAGAMMQAVADGKAPKAARAAAAPTLPLKKDQSQPGARRGAPRPLLLGAAVAVVVVLALVAFLFMRPDGSGDGAGDDLASESTPTAAAASPVPSDGPGSATPTPSPSAAASPDPTPTPAANEGGAGTGGARPALPGGWRDYKDPTGFSVYLPNGWRQEQRGTMVYFIGSNGRVLGVDQTDKPRPDPVADWREQAASRSGGGEFPNYRQVRIEAVNYFQKAADWEWTYNADGIGPVHVNNRGVVTSPTQAYGIYWQTNASDWDAAQADLQLIFASFVPAS